MENRIIGRTRSESRNLGLAPAQACGTSTTGRQEVNTETAALRRRKDLAFPTVADQVSPPLKAKGWLRRYAGPSPGPQEAQDQNHGPQEEQNQPWPVGGETLEHGAQEAQRRSTGLRTKMFFPSAALRAAPGCAANDTRTRYCRREECWGTARVVRRHVSTVESNVPRCCCVLRPVDANENHSCSQSRARTVNRR
jgi:hypothetical protein